MKKVMLEIDLEIAQALLPLLVNAARGFKVAEGAGRMYRRKGRLLRQVAFDLGRAITRQYPDLDTLGGTK